MCMSCQTLRVNGMITHEIGCPDAWRYYSISCKWCGTEFLPEERYQNCCSHSCGVAYNNLECNCEECNPDIEE